MYYIPANFIGQTLYFKFQSVNIFGSGAQDLSTCAVYSFQPLYQSPIQQLIQQAGTSPSSPPAPPADAIAVQLSTGFPLDLGAINGTVTLADDFGGGGGRHGGRQDRSRLGPAPVLGAIATQIHNAIVGGYTPPVDLGYVTSYPTLADDFGSVVDAVGSIAGSTLDLEHGSPP